MGTVIHRAVLVSVAAYILGATGADPDGNGPHMPDLEEFRRSMPEEIRHLVVGPIAHQVNGGITYAMFAPGGSKEGWEPERVAAEWRQRFIDLFAQTYGDGSSPFEVVAVEWGSDLWGMTGNSANITFTQPPAEEKALPPSA